MTLKPARFLDPKSDLVFKRIFGQHPHLTKSLLNSLLPLPKGRQIETIEYLTPEQVPPIPAMKNTIVDVKCSDQEGRVFIVEMQMQWIESFRKRLLFGTSKAYVNQLDKGENYSSLCPVYGIGIINDIFDHKSPEWFHHYKTINVHNSKKILEGLELTFIELPKFQPQTWTQKKMGVLWLRFLREIDEKTHQVDEALLKEPEISKALELSQESAYTKAELEVYDKYWDNISVQKTYFVDGFEKGIEKGMKKGIKQGIDIGREKGRTEGEQIGIAKSKAQIDKAKAEAQEAKAEALEKSKIIARNMLSLGISKNIIAQATGLSDVEMDSL